MPVRMSRRGSQRRWPSSLSPPAVARMRDDEVRRWWRMVVMGFLEGHAEGGVEVVRGKKLEVAWKQVLAMVVVFVPTWQGFILNGRAWWNGGLLAAA